MTQRLDYTALSDELFQQYLNLDAAIKSSLPSELSSLVTIRASQMNGCAFCVDMHTKEAKKHEVDGLKLHHIPIWRGSPLFTEKEKMALLWTEVLTQMSGLGVSDEVYSEVSSVFEEKELSDLSFLVSIINGWNRLSVAFRNVPGSADKAFGLDQVKFA